MTHGEPQHLFRVEKGNPDAAELAALTSVFLAGAVRNTDAGDRPEPGPAARWRRRERIFAYTCPTSWRGARG